MAQIRKNLAGEEDLAFDQNRNNETYEIVDSNGQLAIRHKINSKSIPVSADLVYGNNQNVYDYLVDLVELLNKFAVFEDTGASQLFFNKSQVDYIVVNSDLALLTKIPVGDVAVFAVGGSVQLNPEDFTVDGSIVTFLDGVFADGAKVACLYSTNDYAFPPLEDGDTDERIEQLEAEQVIQNVAIDARSKWIYPPKAQGELWIKNDWTRDGDWTMICNNDTTERPAPVPSGDQESSTPVEPVLITSDFSGFVQSGQVFTFTDSGLFQVVEVYVPTVSNDIAYRFLIIDETDINNPIVRIVDSPLLTAGEWNIITIGSYIVSVGTILRIQAEALNSGSSTEVTGGWLYEGTNNAGTPTTSEWNRSTQQDILRINKTDIDLISRDAELNGIIAGSKIQMAQTDTPSNSYTYTVNSILVDGTDYVEYSVTLDTTGGGGPAVGSATSMTATVPVPQLTEYSEEAGYYGSNSPNFADVTGFLTLGGAPQVSVDNSLFGVRINFQPYYNSPDWDIVAVASATGSSGGGGSGDFLPIVGGTMAGNIDMNKYDINRVGDMTLGEFSNFEREIKFRSSDEVAQTDYSAKITREAGSNADFIIESLGAGKILINTDGGGVDIDSMVTASAGMAVTGTITQTGGGIETSGTINSTSAITGLSVGTNTADGGVNGGDVQINVNDGGGNSNLTFNNANLIPDQNGNYGRITVNTDISIDAVMEFAIGEAGILGTPVILTDSMRLTIDSLYPKVDSKMDLGRTGNRWKTLWIDEAEIVGNIEMDNGVIRGMTALDMGRIDANSSPLIDFRASTDASQVDYSARIIRGSGTNAGLTLTNLGTGTIALNSGGNVSLNPATNIVTVQNSNIQNVLDPVNNQDASTKAYSDKRTGRRHWVRVDNGTTVPTLGSQSGVSSVVRTATGRYTINLSNPVSSIFAIQINFTIISDTSSGRNHTYDLDASTTSAIKIATVNSSGSYTDTNRFVISIQDLNT